MLERSNLLRYYKPVAALSSIESVQSEESIDELNKRKGRALCDDRFFALCDRIRQARDTGLRAQNDNRAGPCATTPFDFSTDSDNPGIQHDAMHH